MLIWVAIVLYFVPAKFITEYLGVSNNYLGVILGGLMGSISLMPGFIAYPLSGILLQQGVSYMTISSFVTTLMMVGVITYPVEKKYFGVKVTILRNVLSLITALIISLVIGLFYGELI